jgi:hypothetical protein
MLILKLIWKKLVLNLKNRIIKINWKNHISMYNLHF